MYKLVPRIIYVPGKYDCGPPYKCISYTYVVHVESLGTDDAMHYEVWQSAEYSTSHVY